MSTHNICFHGEIRNKSILLVVKNAFTRAKTSFVSVRPQILLFVFYFQVTVMEEVGVMDIVMAVEKRPSLISQKLII